jgi:hypothetical protein
MLASIPRHSVVGLVISALAILGICALWFPFHQPVKTVSESLPLEPNELPGGQPMFSISGSGNSGWDFGNHKTAAAVYSPVNVIYGDGSLPDGPTPFDSTRADQIWTRDVCRASTTKWIDKDSILLPNSGPP